LAFLQNDTNSIILDCVLTDKGRQLLAKNDGSFSIVKFAPGDDEVDYTIIQKFGRTVGKEKIEKNTPIFEALTNGSLSQKYRLISVSDQSLIRLPSLTLAGSGITNNVVSIGNTTVRQRQLTLSQEIQNNGGPIDPELRDQAFIVEMSNMFLSVIGQAHPDSVDGQQRATYILIRDSAETSNGGSQLTFSIATKAISQSQFSIYGSVADKSKINTFVRVSGVQSGAVIEFQVTIDQTA
jgi:hypothetical protein